jgi:hypothetical protein
MDFYIGKTFDGKVPAEAWDWCSNNNAHIEDTNKDTKVSVVEEYTSVEYVTEEYTVEEPRMTDGGKIVMVPVTKTRTVPVEKKEHRTVEKTVRVYKLVENPPLPEIKTVRTFSKFSIWVTTQNILISLADGTQTTVWSEFEKFLNNTYTENGNSLMSGWMNLKDLVEDNRFFEQFYPQAVELFGKELVDNVLENSVSGVEKRIAKKED